MRIKPSLESLVENDDIGLDIFHPGGTNITLELAKLCGIKKNHKVLEVASGSGESSCILTRNFGCEITGIDLSDHLLEQAREKAKIHNLQIDFTKADAHSLPYHDASFDVVISECSLSLMDQKKALSEMVRVLKSGGTLGIADIYWKENTLEDLKQKLFELEGERTETLEGWKKLFENANLSEITTIEKPTLMSEWMKQTKKELGISGQLKIFWKALRRWGITGLIHLKKTEDIFQDEHLGYALFKAVKL